jgi:hypothetical protein
MIHPDRLWSDGPVRAAVRIGLPAGLGYWLLMFLMTGSARGAFFGAVFSGVTFGAFMASVIRGRWPRSSDLAPNDRVAVARAVRKGEDIQDERLAGAVIHYARIVRHTQERDARWTWVGVVLAVVTLICAIFSTADGSTREAVMFWLFTAFWVVAIAWVMPRQRARAIANAQRAELAARSKRSGSVEG